MMFARYAVPLTPKALAEAYGCTEKQGEILMGGSRVAQAVRALGPLRVHWKNGKGPYLDGQPVADAMHLIDAARRKDGGEAA